MFVWGTDAFVRPSRAKLGSALPKNSILSLILRDAAIHRPNIALLSSMALAAEGIYCAR
jgi:hypothetical protein